MSYDTSGASHRQNDIVLSDLAADLGDGPYQENTSLSGGTAEKLKDIAGDVESVKELSAEAKARQGMTYIVLAGVLALLSIFGSWYILSESHLAKLRVEFVSLCTNGSDIPEVNAFCERHDQETLGGNDAAGEVFEFVKNFVPPIVTLVLGAHYVTKSKDQE